MTYTEKLDAQTRELARLNRKVREARDPRYLADLEHRARLALQASTERCADLNTLLDKITRLRCASP